MKCLIDKKSISEEEIGDLVREIHTHLPERFCLFVEGSVGVGKTTLLCRLFPQEQMSSPTYALAQAGTSVVHLDLYRLRSEEEIFDLELDQLQQRYFKFVFEWSEQYKELIDDFFTQQVERFLLNIEFDPMGAGRRYYTLFSY